jgi:2,3-diketo-5-methylthio-1-phosphopentane phosphatase
MGVGCHGQLDRIPPPGTAEVWIDFDGTLTKVDVVDSLVRGYCANDDWRAVEDAWQSGRIGSRTCLAEQFELIHIGAKQLDAFLASVSFDPGASDLLALLRRYDVPTTILSDGIDWFIERIFRAHDLEAPLVRSNTLVRGAESWRLVCPFFAPACDVAAAHCKCMSMESLGNPGRQRIYIGDGRSDLCAAKKADVRFAKGTLAAHLQDDGLAFFPFTTLRDVVRALDVVWSHPKVCAA